MIILAEVARNPHPNLYCVIVRKPLEVKSTRVYHGTRNPQGGSFETSDAGWSIKRAVEAETNKLRHILSPGDQYMVCINDVYTGPFTI
jgi:hypothetical protein